MTIYPIRTSPISSLLLHLTLAILFCISSISSVNAGGVAERGQTKVQACLACHAVGGNWNKPLLPEYPLLAGQHYDYLVVALTAYKNPEQSFVGRQNAIMAGQVTTLTSQDIQDIAAYLSQMQGSPLHVKR